MKTLLGTILLCLGIMAMAGSAGDCDGACGPGNDLATMLMVAGAGLMSSILGGILLMSRATE